MFQRHATFICRTEVLGAPETSFLMPNYENTTTPTPACSELYPIPTPSRRYPPLRKLVFAAFLPFLKLAPRLCRLRRLYTCYVHPIAAAASAVALNCNLEIQDDRNRILAAISHHPQTGKGGEGRPKEAAAAAKWLMRPP